MEKTFGYFIFGGLLIGAMFGLIWAGGRNPVMGIGIGHWSASLSDGSSQLLSSSKGRRKNSEIL